MGGGMGKDGTAFLIFVIIIIVLKERGLGVHWRLETFKTVRDLLIALHKKLREVASQRVSGKNMMRCNRGGVLGKGVCQMGNLRSEDFVAGVVKARGKTPVSNTAGTTDSVHVLVDAVREIIVDHVHDIFYIETTGSDVSRNEDWGFPITKCNHGVLATSTLRYTGGVEGLCLALPLGSIPVDRGARKLEIIQIIIKAVASTFGLDEDQGASRRLFKEQIHKSLLLLVFVDKKDL